MVCTRIRVSWERYGALKIKLPAILCIFSNLYYIHKGNQAPKPGRLALFGPNRGTYRHGRGTHGLGLTWGSRWCHWKSGNPDPDRARAEKPFPFCPIVAQPGHLQTSAGYLWIKFDLRIPTVPKNPDFRVRISRKLRKTEKTEKSGNCMWHIKLKLIACWFMQTH